MLKITQHLFFYLTKSLGFVKINRLIK